MGEYSRDEERGEHLKDYWPLIVLIILSFSGAFALKLNYQSSWQETLHLFMGVFFLIFSMLKIFDLKQFASGFAMYDLIAKKSKVYGYIYPFLELTLAMLYLSESFLKEAYIFTIVLMLFSAIGVFIAIRNDVDINCPCMGNVLKVPLSTVTLTEDLGMGVMALVMLLNVI